MELRWGSTIPGRVFLENNGWFERLICHHKIIYNEFGGYAITFVIRRGNTPNLELTFI
jgi:hypothetical protein